MRTPYATAAVLGLAITGSGIWWMKQTDDRNGTDMHDAAAGAAHMPAEEMAGGLLPTPPHLGEAAAHWEARDVFWIVQNGIKMTGMPAFGQDHEDEAILEIVAFVKQLPGMTAEQYREFTAGGGHRHGGQPSGGRDARGHNAGAPQPAPTG